MLKNEMDLNLDLLVDDELPDEQRAQLLRHMGSAEWRDLSLRFLQRQVERKTVRTMVSAQQPCAPEQPADVAGRIGAPQARALFKAAAMIAIVAGAVGITAYVMRGGQSADRNGGPIASGLPETVNVAIPGDVTGDSKGKLELGVPVLAHTDGISSSMFLPADEERGSKQSLVIIKQDNDKAIAVPVSTSNLIWN
jgi:hypothetical protein